MQYKHIHISWMMVITSALCCGCDTDSTPRPVNQREVMMNGVIGAATKAPIDPETTGLPSKQLTIGILTSDYYLPDTEDAFKPELLKDEDWGMYTYLDRGYFGGPGLGAINITNGEIKYTSADGNIIQNVLYDESGMYYVLRLIYPYTYTYLDNNTPKETTAQLSLASNGSRVFFDIDGSQDVMSTNVGWGNMDYDWVTTSTATDPNDSETNYEGFTFSHHLVKLDIRLLAEAGTFIAKEEGEYNIYGAIESVELINQPNQVTLDLTTNLLSASSSLVSTYPIFSYDTDGKATDIPIKTSVNLSKNETGTLYGYVMALPAQKYTFKVVTGSRKSFYINAYIKEMYDVEVPKEGSETETTTVQVEGGAKPGTIYPLTFKFLASEEVGLEADKAKEWWFDSVFN